MEGGDIYAGKVDVIVCDGFIGNVALKVSEGLGDMVKRMLRESLEATITRKIGYALAKNAFNDFRKRLDYSEYGGAPLLGVRGVCIICHGRSNANAIKNAIRVAAEFSAGKINQRIEDELRGVQRRSWSLTPVKAAWPVPAASGALRSGARQCALAMWSLAAEPTRGRAGRARAGPGHGADRSGLASLFGLDARRHPGHLSVRAQRGGRADARVPAAAPKRAFDANFDVGNRDLRRPGGLPAGAAAEEGCPGRARPNWPSASATRPATTRSACRRGGPVPCASRWTRRRRRRRAIPSGYRRSESAPTARGSPGNAPVQGLGRVSCWWLSASGWPASSRRACSP